MAQTQDYIVVEEHSAKELQKTVVFWIKRGYEPLGAPTVVVFGMARYYIQAMSIKL